MAGVFWRGADGKVYVKGNQGTNAAGDWNNGTTQYWTQRGFNYIPDPVATNTAAISRDQLSNGGTYGQVDTGSGGYLGVSPGGGYVGSYGGGYDPYAAQRAAEAEAEAKRVAERDALRGEIGGFRGGIENTFAELFRLINQQAQSRRNNIARTYDEQNAQYTSEFEKAMPAIATAFAALGLGNSTFAGDREDTTTNEYKSALGKSATNRKLDLADVGRWRDQNIGEYRSQRDNMLASIKDAQSSENVNELRDARNNIRTGLNNAKGSKGRFGSDGNAVKSLQANTNRSAGFSDAFNAYQSVLNSSMDVGTKGAVKEAMLQYGDLNEDERKKLTEVQINNPYQTRVS